MNSNQLQDFLSELEMTLPDPEEMGQYFERLWPICRSITGNGLRQSLDIINEIIPLETVEVPSGSKVLDWEVPPEWNISEAYLENEAGQRVIDFKNHNLHVLNYSEPVDLYLNWEDLQKHLYSLPNLPDAIPYVTSYYQKNWGFCLAHAQREKLKKEKYHAVIRSTLLPGNLTYGHCVLPSSSGNAQEFLISTYLCHPSMANNELSGPLVAAFLYRCLAKLKKRKYNYRFVFAPETIGAITYLSQYGDHLKKHCQGGLVVTCCGDDKKITYKKSRQGNATIDDCVGTVLKNHGKEFQIVDFFPMGSDERQYCAPGFNLPVGSLMRSMYGTYPEYHTSLDNPAFISLPALRETLMLYLKTIALFESKVFYINQLPLGEPMLGKRNLYPATGGLYDQREKVNQMLYLLNYADGKHDLSAIAEKAKCSELALQEIAGKLVQAGLLKEQG